MPKRILSNSGLLFLITFALVSFAHASPTKIGANLKSFKQVHGQKCDARVPKDYATIQSAIDASIVGDTVCVEAGLYAEDVTIDKSLRLVGSGATHPSGNANNAQKHLSIIEGQNPNGAGTVYVTSDDVTLEGFVIQGAGSDYTSSALRIAEGLTGVIAQFNHVVASNGSIAVLFGGDQSQHLLAHNILEGNNSPQVVIVNGLPTTGKASSEVNFQHNNFEGTVAPTERQDTGIVLSTGATNSLIEKNVFNTAGVITELVQSAYASNAVNENNLNSNANLKVRVGTGGTLNAENNWWGDLDPSDNVSGLVDFTPFQTEPYLEH